MRKQLFIAICLLSIAVQCTTAATIAYWRFDEAGKVSGDPVTKPFGALDSSGNGYHLDPWTAGGWAGFVYRTDVAMSAIPQTGAINNLSVKNDGGYPGMATDSTAAIRTITPSQFTIEAFFKPEDGDHRTIVGRDSQGAASTNTALSALYFKINPNEGVEISFGDVSGYWHVAASQAGLIQGFIWGSDPDGLLGNWYYMAAISDGKTLSLYLANVTTGSDLQLVAQTDLTQSGSPNTALTAGTGDGGDWDAGNWSVGRGLYDGGHVDRAYGFIDEVRISDVALDLEYLLFNSRFNAWHPTPAEGTPNYGVSPDGVKVNADLSWNAGIDPDNPEQANPLIKTHYLYKSADQNKSNDPNLYYVTAIPAVGNTGQTTLTGLNYDGLYLWRVDEGVDNGTGVAYPAGDPNNIAGKVWSFGTLLSVPVITQHPANVVTPAGTTAEFTVVVNSISPPQYEWFKSDDKANNTFADDQSVSALSFDNKLTLTGVQVDDEGYYYCKVINEGGSASARYSNIATLTIARLMAHWTLDQADYVGGQYLDKSGNGRHADPNGAPSFVPGQLGQGVDILRASGEQPYPATNSWASAGTWNPSEVSGHLSVSFWMKWAGLNGTWQGFITKRSRSAWDNANVLWQISSDNGLPHLWFQSPRSLISVNNGLVAGQWQYIVATFDGTTAKIYVNGQQRASGTFQFGDAVDGMICLGGNSFELGGQEFMNGTLDEVKFFNYALTEMQVAQMYVADAPGKTACIQSLKPSTQYDVNNDCIVDIADFAIWAATWLECGLVPDCLP
jgi:hypothetical protein